VVQLYKFISLAVFGSVCFIFGFLFNQYTFDDEKSLELLKQGYVTYLEDSSEIQEFNNQMLLIKIAEGCQKEDCTDLIEHAFKPKVKEFIDRFEQGAFKGFQRKMLERDIVKVKKLFENET
jgi:hypothetical protein